MSVLTKVLVTLLTVASIALSMLVVGAFAKQENWKATAQKFETDYNAESARTRALSAQLQLEKTQYQRQLKDVRGELATAQADFEKSEIARKELVLAVADAKSTLTVEQAQVTSTVSQLGQLQNALARSEDFADKLTARNSELERRNIDLNSRVEELITNVQMARQQVRALQQQITSLEETQVAVGPKAPGEAVPAVGSDQVVEEYTPSASMARAPAMASPISGEVTRVEGNLASISVGSADGVTTGAKFLIYRRVSGSGPHFLGTLRISRVESNSAAGSLENSQNDIRPGDLARDEASFGRRG